MFHHVSTAIRHAQIAPPTALRGGSGCIRTCVCCDVTDALFVRMSVDDGVAAAAEIFAYCVYLCIIGGSRSFLIQGSGTGCGCNLATFFAHHQQQTQQKLYHISRFRDRSEKFRAADTGSGLATCWLCAPSPLADSKYCQKNNLTIPKGRRLPPRPLDPTLLR
jgi:hypothetical protein